MAAENVNTTETEEVEIEDFACSFCEFSTKDLEELDEHVVVFHEERYFEDGTTEEDSRPQIEYVIVPDDPPTSPTPEEKPKNTICFYNKEPTNPNKKYKIVGDSDLEDALSIYVCPYCDYQTTKRNSMPVHIQTEHETNGTPITYQCSECPYQTRRKADMPKHLLTHCSEGSIEMFQCPYCTYQTKRKNDLPKHMLCHQKGANLFICPHCDYSTKRQPDLIKHSMGHKKFGPNSGAKGFYEDAYDRVYNCTECGYTARRLNDLHRHVILHTDGQFTGIYKCRNCSYSSPKSNSFAKHLLNGCMKEQGFKRVGQAVEEQSQNYLEAFDVAVDVQEHANEDPTGIDQQDIIEEHQVLSVKSVEIVEFSQ